MGMLTKLLGLKVAQKVVQKMEARSDRKDAELRGEYLAAGRPAPAPASGWNRQAVLQKAGHFYHRNPKLVASVATVLVAGVAAALAKKRRMY